MLKIYDTVARKKREFVPIEKGKVKMYVCGPTVYNKIHIGNARTFISFDIIRRYLEHIGYDVTFVQNLTDVDDKIINKAIECGKSAQSVADEFSEKFISDMHSANVIDPTIRPRATQEIPEMIELIEKLIAEGHAYENEGDVYFSVETDETYGCLSHRNANDGQSGHRELIGDDLNVADRKKSNSDFALWKASKAGEPAWDSPFGEGRPGWHTECACMSKKYLGLPFDIHGGGADLIFPHHENEIAQAQCAWHSGFANYWIHSGMLNVDNEKMSKSLGNFLMLDDVLDKIGPNILRMLIIQTHYRSPLNYSTKRLEEAKKALQSFQNCISNIKWLIDNSQESDEKTIDDKQVHQEIEKTKANFTDCMNDDFNAPAALGELSIFLSFANKVFTNHTLSTADVQIAQETINFIISCFDIFGINLQDEEQQKSAKNDQLSAVLSNLLDAVPSNIDEAFALILEKRAQARTNKDWATADVIRDQLLQVGYAIEDTPQGSKIKRV